MRTSGAKITSTATTLQKKESKPFFAKNGEGSFFSKSNEFPKSFFSPSIIQPKLTVGQPNDKYEQEADAMADKVVQRLATPDVLSKKETGVQAKPVATAITPLIQTKCTSCEQEEKLQKKEDDDLVQESPLELQLKPIFESNAAPPDDEDNIQRKCAECEKEEKLQKKEVAKEIKKEEGSESLHLRPLVNGVANPDVSQKISISEIAGNNDIKNNVQQKVLNSESLACVASNIVQTKCATCEHEEKLQKKEDEDLVQESPLELQLKPIFESNSEPPDDEDNIQRKCAKCEKEEKIQTKPGAFDSQTVSSNIESSLKSSKGGGAPMSAETKGQMENSFGTDFSNIRIHDDSSAVQMSKELNAQAFTHGSDIYFNSGKYDTSSSSGQHLLAHELTHTVQQSGVSRVRTKPDMVQRVCDHSKCSGDFLRPSCPDPAAFLTNPTLKAIRYSIFDSVSHPLFVKKNDTGDAITLLKQYLLNFYCSGFDRAKMETEPKWYFDSGMKEAVVYFQQHHDDSNGEPLQVDGRVGPATLGAIDAEMGLSVVPLPKAATGKGDCLGVAEQGPGLTRKWDVLNPSYLKIAPFFPATQAWEIYNFDIDMHFLKTEHRDFLIGTVVPGIQDAVAKSKTPMKVRIIGEASTTASRPHNIFLSFRRANCVVSTLTGFGLDTALIETPVTPLGEELTRVMPIIQGTATTPIDNQEDLAARKVTIVLHAEDAGDCDRMKPATDYLAYVVCNTPNSYRIIIMNLTDPGKPVYREFIWTHDDQLPAGCEFSPGFGPGWVFRFDINTPLRLAKKDPDDWLGDSDFQGPTLHVYDDKGMRIYKFGVVPAFELPVPGDWLPKGCEEDNVFMTGELNPIGPVICGMPTPPSSSEQCKKKDEKDCTPGKKQRLAKKYTAQMKWISADIVKLIKKIPYVKRITKKLDDWLDFFGIDINTSVTAAYMDIGTTDDKGSPIKRRFYFAGGEITGSSLPLFDMSSVYAEDYTVDTPKQLEKSGGDSDFAGFAELVIKGGTNQQELHISGLDKPIVFKGTLCDPGGDKKSTGYMSAKDTSCSQLASVPKSDKTCKEEKEDCSDSQKLKTDQKFLIKTGRATVADLPLIGKRMADKLGCAVTGVFINIGTNDGEEKDRIYRQFIFVGKNANCKFAVEKGSQQKSFLVPRALTYPDPNDMLSLSDFSGAGRLTKGKELSIISPKNFPFSIAIPGAFDAACVDPHADGVMVPVSAVDCGPVPDPPHSTKPDITDITRCEEFKKTHAALVSGALADLAGRHKSKVDSITDPPRLIYPLYNDLFYKVGQTLINASFFGKAYDGQRVVTIVDMHVISIFPDALKRYVFNVKFLSAPCSFNEAGEAVLVMPKDCREAYITMDGDYEIYPLPKEEDQDTDPDTDKTAESSNTVPHPTDDGKCHGDCHSLGIIPGFDTPSPGLKTGEGFIGRVPDLQPCPECELETVQALTEHESGTQQESLLQQKCASCEKEEVLQKKPNISPKTAPSNIESSLISSKVSGNPLPAAARDQMESSFGADFSNVRIHNDSTAVEMNKDLNAQAFTSGSDIYFNSGKYDANSVGGKHLLAHELTHVLQQGHFIKRKVIQRQGDTTPSTAEGNPSTSASAQTTIPATMACNPQGLSRADFLSRNGNDKSEFGHTVIMADSGMLNPSTLTFQRVGRGRGIKPVAVTVTLPAIESIFTRAGIFIEGSQRVVFDAGGDCLTDTYDLQWRISTGGAGKIQEGEQEHCNDYNYAYAHSVLRYVTEVNRLAAGTRTFGSEREATRFIQRRIGFDPDDWFTRFGCLLQQSLQRDRVIRGFTRSSHDPIPFTNPPNRYNRCRYATVSITERSLPQVGQTPSASIITGC